MGGEKCFHQNLVPQTSRNLKTMVNDTLSNFSFKPSATLCVYLFQEHWYRRVLYLSRCLGHKKFS